MYISLFQLLHNTHSSLTLRLEEENFANFGWVDHLNTNYFLDAIASLALGL